MREVRQKQKPFRSQRYMRWVRTLPCSTCGTDQGVQAHHIIGHGHGGKAIKAPDHLTMPLCAVCHTELHHYGHKRFDNRWSTINEPGQVYFVRQTLQRARTDSQLRPDMITEAEDML